MSMSKYTSQQAPPKPNITSVRQLNERAVTIGWTVENAFNYNLTKYVIELMRDDSDEIIEWPAQMIQAEYFPKSLTGLKQAESFFDGRNKCIYDNDCVFSVCYISQSSAVSGGCSCYHFSQIPNGTEKNEFYEVYMMKDYNDTNVTIDQLPYNHVYKFRVKVLDRKSKKWSEVSDWSNEVDMRIQLQLSAKRISSDALKIQWHQNNSLSEANYSISKYKLVIWKDGLFYRNESIINENIFDKLDLFPNYDSYESINETTEGSMSESECYNNCRDNDDCIFAVHFYERSVVQNQPFEKNSCYKRTNLDFIKGGLKRKNSTLIRFKNTASEYEINSLELNADYEIILECITPFGSLCSLNKIQYNLTDIIPSVRIDDKPYQLDTTIIWSINDDLELNKIQIFQEKNKANGYLTYYTESQIAFNGTIGSPLNLDLTSCYQACFENSKCMSIIWNKDNNCMLTYNNNIISSCPKDTKCIHLIDSKNSKIEIKDQFVNTDYCYKIKLRAPNDYTSLLSDSVCTRFNFSVNIRKLDGDFENNMPSRLLCSYTRVNESLVEVVWYKDDSVVNLNALYGEIINDPNLGNILKFNKTANNIHNGIYNCAVKLKGQQTITSESINITVIYIGELELNNGQSEITIKENDTINISCSAEGVPVRNIELSLNNSVLDTSVNVTESLNGTFKNLVFSITNAQRSKNNGVYKCFDVVNNIEKRFELIVLGKPSKPIIKNVRHYESSTEIEWHLDDDGGTNLTELRIEWSSNSSFYSGNYEKVDEYKITNPLYISKVISGKNYIRLTAINKIGMSSMSDEVGIENPLSSPKNYYLIIGISVASCVVIVCIIGFIIIWRRIKGKNDYDEASVTSGTYSMPDLFDKNQSQSDDGYEYMPSNDVNDNREIDPVYDYQESRNKSEYEYSSANKETRVSINNQSSEV